MREGSASSQGVIRLQEEWVPSSRVPRDVETRHFRPTHSLHSFCKGCGVLAWDVPEERFLPGYGQKLICWNCGEDNSRRPPLFWRGKEWMKGKRRQLRRRLVRMMR